MNKKGKERTVELYRDLRKHLQSHVEANFSKMSDEEYFEVLEVDNVLRLKVDQLKLQILMDDVNSVDHKELEREMNRRKGRVETDG